MLFLIIVQPQHREVRSEILCTMQVGVQGQDGTTDSIRILFPDFFIICETKPLIINLINLASRCITLMNENIIF